MSKQLINRQFKWRFSSYIYSLQLPINLWLLFKFILKPLFYSYTCKYTFVSIFFSRNKFIYKTINYLGFYFYFITLSSLAKLWQPLAVFNVTSKEVLFFPHKSFCVLFFQFIVFCFVCFESCWLFYCYIWRQWTFLL